MTDLGIYVLFVSFGAVLVIVGDFVSKYILLKLKIKLERKEKQK